MKHAAGTFIRGVVIQLGCLMSAFGLWTFWRDFPSAIGINAVGLGLLGFLYLLFWVVLTAMAGMGARQFERETEPAVPA